MTTGLMLSLYDNHQTEKNLSLADDYYIIDLSQTFSTLQIIAHLFCPKPTK